MGDPEGRDDQRGRGDRVRPRHRLDRGGEARGPSGALDRNPLDDIVNTLAIRYVMKNGRLYEGDTLKEIWPREADAPALWW